MYVDSKKIMRHNPTEELDHLKKKAKTPTDTHVPSGISAHEHSELSKCTSSSGMEVTCVYLHSSIPKFICPYGQRVQE